MRCFVPTCSNKSDQRRPKGVTFHKIPELLKHEWLQAIKRSIADLSADKRVCSKHFQKTDFFVGNRRIIKPDVIPTLHLPTDEMIKKISIKKSTKFVVKKPWWKPLKPLPTYYRNRDKKSRKLDSSASFVSKEIQDYSYIFTEHSYSLWRRPKTERKKNIQFEFVNCMAETDFLENAEDTNIQDFISKEEELLVKKEFENNTSIETTENKEYLNMSDIYLNQVKTETLGDVELFPFKIKEEEIFIKNEVIEEEFESSPSIIKTEEEEEIDVVSLGDSTSKMAALPTNPSTKDRRLQRTKQSHFLQGIKTTKVRRTQPKGKPETPRAGRARRYKRVNQRQYKRRSLYRRSSDSESEPSEKRNLHKNMERQRRIYLRNLFNNLKKLVPVVNKKQRAAKVLILSGAAQYCRDLTNTNETLEHRVEFMRKQQQRFRARLSQLRLDFEAKR